MCRRHAGSALYTKWGDGRGQPEGLPDISMSVIIFRRILLVRKIVFYLYWRPSEISCFCIRVSHSQVWELQSCVQLQSHHQAEGGKGKFYLI